MVTPHFYSIWDYEEDISGQAHHAEAQAVPFHTDVRLVPEGLESARREPASREDPVDTEQVGFSTHQRCVASMRNSAGQDFIFLQTLDGLCGNP